MHDRLNAFVDVVVDVLSFDCGSYGGGVLRVADCLGVLELCSFCCEAFFNVRVVTVLDVAVLYAAHVVGMLFWQDFAIMDRLDGGMVMVLVYFTVDECLGVFMLSADYSLVLH